MATKEYEVIHTLKSELRALLDRVAELDEKLERYLEQYPPPQELSEPALITVSYLLNNISNSLED